MRRMWILLLSCVFLTSCSANNKSANDGKFTFAGVSLFEKPQLPYCPEINIEELESNFSEEDDRTIDGLFDLFLDSLEEECLLDLGVVGMQSHYRVVTFSDRMLSPGLPVQMIFIDLNKKDEVFMMKFHFDVSLADQIMAYLEKQYQSPDNIQMVRSEIYSYDWNEGDFFLFFTPKEKNFITKQNEATLAIVGRYTNRQ